MKKYTYHFEVRTLIAQFIDAFNDIVVKRYNKDREEQDKIHVNFVYAPKSRVLHDIVNKAGHIKLPIVSVSINSITRDPSRVFNKVAGPLYTLSPEASGYEQLLQPIPVDIAINMSIVTRFQSDIDQIITNFAPYSDPYVVVSWKMPITNLEIRSKIVWSGAINLTEPTDISHNAFYRTVADTSFTIKGWLFKAPSDPAGKIYKIDTHFTSVSDIYNNFGIMKAFENEYETDVFTISARPQLTMCDPFLTTPCLSGRSFNVQGVMLDYVTNMYVSGSPGVYTTCTSGNSSQPCISYYDPASSNALISAMYPGFSGIAIPSGSWNIQTPGLISFNLPQAVSAGYVDVIAFNEAGYGKLTEDAVRPTTNPYPSGSAEYDSYVEWQHPSISGIEVSPFYYNCP